MCVANHIAVSGSLNSVGREKTDKWSMQENMCKSWWFSRSDAMISWANVSSVFGKWLCHCEWATARPHYYDDEWADVSLTHALLLSNAHTESHEVSPGSNTETTQGWMRKKTHHLIAIDMRKTFTCSFEILCNRNTFIDLRHCIGTKQIMGYIIFFWNTDEIIKQKSV